MTKPRILIVDDDPLVLKSLEQLLMDDYDVVPVPSGIEALERLRDGSSFDAVILDIRMPKMDGLKTAGHIKETNADIPIIFYTGYPGDYSEYQIEREYQPFDYIIKNERPARLLRSVRNAVTIYRLKTSPVDLVQLAREQYGMIGRSRAMLDVYHTIEKIAPTDNKVMILGQTGTGKELVARAIHKRSPRAQKRFAILTCNQKQQDLVAAEFFGYLRGSFTGANADREGIFEYADGGVVFLDEIGDLDLNSQAKLLRVLETGEIQQIGSPEITKVNVRLVCATHRDLKSLVQEGRFRDDLYFRLKGVTISLPLLKDRRGDIPDLIDFFVWDYSQKSGTAIKVFEPAARDMLIEFNWPGNVRQLQDTVRALMDLSISSYISRGDVARLLEESDNMSEPMRNLNDQIRAAKKDIISKALARHDNNISAAARELDVDRTNLHKQIKKLGINVGDITTQE